MKRLLRRLHEDLQDRKLFHPNAHGGVRGRSHATSEAMHRNSQFVWYRDVQDCFVSIRRSSVAHEHKRLGFRRDVTSLLARLLTPTGYLIPGSPISVDGANLFFYRLDQMLTDEAASAGAVYSRSADDFILSGNDRLLIDSLDSVFICVV